MFLFAEFLKDYRCFGLAEIVENSDFRDKIHVFDDRSHAGEMLARWLKQYEDREDAIEDEWRFFDWVLCLKLFWVRGRTVTKPCMSSLEKLICSPFGRMTVSS